MDRNEHKWDGKLYNLAISAQHQPELYHELAGLTPKGRAERLRTLAACGLCALRSQGAGLATAPEPPTQESPSNKRNAALKGRLAGTV